MAPAPGSGPVVPKKKISPIVWVLVGIAGFVLLVGIAVIAGGLFLAKKIADNPMLAAATAIAAANPDVELVSNDPNRQTVTFREKSTGKTITLNFDQLKEGRFSFSEDGKEVTMETGEGGLKVKGSDGSTLEVGTGSSKLPDWVPAYPGATMEGAFSSSGGSEQGAMVSFTTSDGADKVVSFFEDGFQQAGLKVTQTVQREGGKISGGMVHAESGDKKQQAVVTISVDQDETNVSVTYSAKK
jgi:hypothetical protein